MSLLRLILPLLLLATLARAETRVFVSLAGTLLEAEIISVSGELVFLKRASDQQSLLVNRKTLCKEDNAYIDRWAEQHLQQPAPAAPPSQK